RAVVDDAVAVVVEAVAQLGGARVNRSDGVVAIFAAAERGFGIRRGTAGRDAIAVGVDSAVGKRAAAVEARIDRARIAVVTFGREDERAPAAVAGCRAALIGRWL